MYLLLTGFHKMSKFEIIKQNGVCTCLKFNIINYIFE